MGIGVLGTLTVDDVPVSLGRRDRIVLAALATRPGRVVTRDGLAEALWPGEPPASSAKVVQGCVARLRRLLGPDAIETASPGYRLAVPEEDVDAVRFERSVGRARDLATLGQVDRAAHLVDDALRLWRGTPFLDVEDWAPGLVEATRLNEVRREAEELRVDCYLRAGRHHEVLADAAALVREGPTREARWALLARAQYQDGGQADALSTVQRAQEMLSQRLGLDPGPELSALRLAILRQDPSLLPEPTRNGAAARCPYRGLAPYDVDDAERFYGRAREVSACLDLLDRRNVVVVVGPSGSGKSSVVRAGVAATLSRRGGRVRVITPGETPVGVLEALPRRSAGDALVVDQCEEVFSLCSDEEQRRVFLDRLVEHAERAPLVVALRADRLADVAPYPSFARLVERGLSLLGAMDETELREAIEAPARDAGLLLEPGLVDLLLREVEGEPGALPLLSHALQGTWLRREGNTLTVAGYRATGGIRGAVAQTAEHVYSQVDPDQRHLVRDLMLRLVSTETQGAASRIRAPRSRVIVQPAQERLVDELVQARLLTSQEGVIEIAHESLASAWPRLRDWLDDDVEGRRILHHVGAAADAWDALGRPDSELYRGTRLRQALEWREHAQVELTLLEEQFLEAARSAAEDEKQALAERARQQSRMIRRLRIALAGGSAFLALALVAGVLAVRQGERAQANERTAQAGRIGARALTVEDPSVALLLAVEAVHIDDSPQTRSYLRAAMARRPGLVASTDPAPTFLMGLSANRERGDVVAYGFDNTVYRFDLASGERVARLDLDGPGVTRNTVYAPGVLAGSSDGELVAVGSINFTAPAVWLLDRETLRPVRDLTGLPPRGGRTVGLDLSQDGRWLAAALNTVPADAESSMEVRPTDQFALVWDLARPTRLPQRIPLPPMVDGWTRIRISDDGATLYGGTPPTAYEVQSGEVLWDRPDLESSGGAHIDLSPDGSLLAVPTDRHGAFLLDTTDRGRTVAQLGDGLEVGGVFFSEDGSRLAAAVARQLRVWDVGTGSTIHQSHHGVGVSIDYSADSSFVYLTGDHGVETWDVDGGRSFVTRRAGPSLPRDGHLELSAFSADGRHRALHVKAQSPYGGTPTQVLLTTTDSGATLQRASVGPTVRPVGAWHPDGTTYVAATESGEVVTVPVRGTVRRFKVGKAPVVDVQYTRDGEHIVVLDESGWIHRLRTTGEPDGTPVRVQGAGTDLAVAPDGRRVFVLTGPPPRGPQELSVVDSWSLVDAAEGGVVGTGTLPEPGDPLGWTFADFAPDADDRVALFGFGGVQVLDLTTGRPVAERVAVHTDYVIAGSYTPDGSMIVSGGADGRVVLWDGEDGALVDVTMVDAGRDVTPVVLPDGHTVVTATPDALYRWDTRIGPALEAACRAAGRSMTDVEWRTNIGDDIPYRATCG